MIFTESLGFTLIDQTPEHALAAATQVPEPPNEAMDIGTVFHACLLTGESTVLLIDAPDWRTRAARDQREAARANGQTPLLYHKWAEVKAMLTAVRRRLEARPDPRPFVGGFAERSLHFRVNGVDCRSTADWVSADNRRIVEVKTTGESAHPAAFSKALWGKGYAFQAALERRAIKTEFGVDAEHEWLVCETYHPYAISSVALDPEAQAFSDQQLDEALRLWRECEETGIWPGYRKQIAYAEVPAWMQAQWAERAYHNAVRV